MNKYKQKKAKMSVKIKEENSIINKIKKIIK